MLVNFDEKLKDIALKIKDIAYKLGLIADYIVEEDIVTTKYGTLTTTWHYKKYNSGFVELVGHRTGSFVAGNFAAWGSLYTAPISGANFPFALKTLWGAECHVYDIDGVYTFMDATVNASDPGPSTTYTGGFCVVRTSKVACSIQVTYKAWGTWK